tara:strand:- start:90 stop:683 length:594 start_codon:yes stop_codon:yes gene_type:complete
MNKFFKYYFLVLCISFSLTSCQTIGKLEKFPTMTFTHLSKLRLLVRDIKIIELQKNQITPPYITHQFPISPAKATRRWARDRLQIGGKKNTARLIIKIAEAKQIPLEIDKTFAGSFKNQQSDRYETEIFAKLEILNEKKEIEAGVEAKAQHFKSVAEATSLSDRRKIWYNMIEVLMNEFNKEIDKNINNNFQKYLIK